ncbi:MAG TPA: TRAP transporter substrate-binding protein DctP [Rhizobiaceae bacterium]|nr:TRAP transporter substrate-binding protein DctP [Rhizobiaceae bacterium]
MAAALASAAAQDVTLRIADSLPVGHYTSTQGIQPWIKAIEERTGGAVKLDYYPASQLGQGKDLLALTQSGVTDIALIQPAYISEKLPLSGIVELPELFPSSCDGTKAYFQASAEGGILGDEEYGPNGVRLLFGAILSPYQLLTKAIPVETVDQLKGAKLRTGGGTQDLLVSKLGAVPVRVPGPEMYEAVSRGTADGVILPYASVITYDLQKLLGYTTVTSGFGTTVTAYMINEDKWKELSPEHQQILAETGYEASMALCAYIDAQADEALKKLEEAGVKRSEMPDAEKTKMSEVLGTAAGEWAAALDARGLPASDLLKAMKSGGTN